MKPEAVIEHIEKSAKTNHEIANFFRDWIPSDNLNDVAIKDGRVHISDKDGDMHEMPMRWYIMLCMVHDGECVMTNIVFEQYTDGLIKILRKMSKILESNDKKSKSLSDDIDRLSKRQKGIMAVTGFSWIGRFLGIS